MSIDQRRAHVCLAGCLLALWASWGRAAQRDAVWIGGSGTWNTPARWNINEVPNNTASDTFRVFIDSGAAPLSEVSLTSGIAVDSVTIDAGDVLAVANGQTLRISTGPLANAGTLSLNATTSNTEVRLDGDVSLTGGGTVAMSNASSNRIVGSVATLRLLNVDNTIRGSGQLGASNIGIANQRLIQADQSIPLVIDPSSGGAINSGTMRAIGGATLALQDGSFDNNGGLIQAAAGSSVVLNGAILVGGTLSTQGDGRITVSGVSTLQDIVGSSRITITNGVALNLAGSFINAGSIRLESAGSLTDLRINSDIVLDGGGTITLSNAAGNRILGSATTFRLTNLNNTIRGAGQVGASNMALTNRGLIEASEATPLVIDPSMSGAINSGTLRAVNGATLTLQGGEIDNTGGLIEAQANSELVLSAVNITGGVLTTGPGGHATVSGPTTLRNVTNSGEITANAGTGLTLDEGISNPGMIKLSGGAGTAELRIKSDIRLTGGGSLILSDSQNNRMIGNTTGLRLTNVDNTIRGAGQIGLSTMGLTNQGTIIADQATVLTIDVQDSQSFENQGTLTAAGTGGMSISTGPFTTSGTVSINVGSQLSRSGSYNQSGGLTTIAGTLSITTGYLQSGGTTLLRGGTLAGVGGSVQLDGGLLSGRGTIGRPLINNVGVVQPGLFAGQRVISASQTYVQQSGGTLSIEIGGRTPGSEYAVFAATGSVTLGGTLRVILRGGFAPQIGDAFVVMNFASRMGTFATLDFPCLLAQGRQFQISYTPTNVVLTVVPAATLLGDMNCNCVRDPEDLTDFILALVNPAGYAAALPACDVLVGDFNGDQRLNGADIQAFLDSLSP